MIPPLLRGKGLPLARRETGEGAREAAGEGPGQVEPLLRALHSVESFNPVGIEKPMAPAQTHLGTPLKTAKNLFFFVRGMSVRGMEEGLVWIIPLTIIPLTSLRPCPSSVGHLHVHFGCGWPRWAFCAFSRPFAVFGGMPAAIRFVFLCDLSASARAMQPNGQRLSRRSPGIQSVPKGPAGRGNPRPSIFKVFFLSEKWSHKNLFDCIFLTSLPVKP